MEEEAQIQDSHQKSQEVINSLQKETNLQDALTKKGELDLTGDETSWGHQGFGEKGGGNLFRVANKPAISKGGQTVLVSGTNRIRPHFYQQRHKLNPRYPGMNAAGPSEVRTAIDSLEQLKDSDNTLQRFS